MKKYASNIEMSTKGRRLIDLSGASHEPKQSPPACCMGRVECSKVENSGCVRAHVNVYASKRPTTTRKQPKESLRLIFIF